MGETQSIVAQYVWKDIAACAIYLIIYSIRDTIIVRFFYVMFMFA